MGTHLKVVLSPFGSPGNVMSLLSVRRRKITDKETDVKFQAIYGKFGFPDCSSVSTKEG
jgi:hypothetical protein